MKRSLALASLACVGAASASSAAEILVTSNISTSTTWTANNTYNLQNQIYVLPGATLTIEAGTIVASTTNIGGSLAVSKGAQIFVQGTAQSPVIMTSKADQATWISGDPKTGTWREGANEWGNVTIMGDAYISENATAGNTPTPNANNVAAMEGLVADFVGDPKVLYGGGNDDDDSGSISFLSLRYGGRVIGLNNELNGISLGGIGRGTDIHHVEIMNNVDDGAEIWGGTLNLSNISIWNVGDDSFDVDQGWRGFAQFILVVQGYSLDANQGSGVGDNGFEIDGAEDSDWQPVTTTSIYNATFIGQPDGDGATAWRDNARVQYRNSIFMDCGERVVRFDDIDGDGANGYGFNGTLDWPTTWSTPFTQTSTVNAPGNPAAFYTVQSSGTLNEMSNNVFHNNSDYAEFNALGLNSGFSNVIDDVNLPIRAISRAATVVKGGKDMERVISLDPRPANAALTNAAPTPAPFAPANYCGAFAPDQNWLCGWSASDAFGFIDAPDAEVTIRTDANNVPGSLSASGLPTIGNLGFGWVVDNPTGCAQITAGAPAILLTTAGGAFNLPIPGWGCNGGLGTLLIAPAFLSAGQVFGVYTGGPSVLPFPIPNNPALCGLQLDSQILFGTVPSLQIRAGNAATYVLGE